MTHKALKELDTKYLYEELSLLRRLAAALTRAEDLRIIQRTMSRIRTLLGVN